MCKNELFAKFQNAIDCIKSPRMEEVICYLWTMAPNDVSWQTVLSTAKRSVLRNRVSAGTTIRLICGGTKSGIRIIDIRHGFIRRLWLWRGYLFFGLLLLLRQYQLETFLFRTLHEPSLHSNAAICQVLAAIVAHLLLPVPTAPLAVVSRNDGRPIRFRIDPNATVFVVNLSVSKYKKAWECELYEEYCQNV